MSSSDDIRAPHLRRDDFLGAFAVVERGGELLMVQNRRRIGDREVLVWDLPGGQVERGEVLAEALARELREEVTAAIAGGLRFLFLQEGERRRAGRREYAWRSFFFACELAGEPVASAEVLAVQWVPWAEVPARLVAPYHDSFAIWLRERGTYYRSVWSD